LKPLYSLQMLLSSEIHQLRTSLSLHDMKDEKVSIQSIGWHIEHTLKVIILTCNQLIKSNPQLYQWRFKPIISIHLLRGSIPRGKTKTPEYLKTDHFTSIKELMKQLEIAQERLEQVENLHPNSFFRHPYYGKLNLKQTFNFLKIHTNHHLKIIDEIEYYCIYDQSKNEVLMD